MEDNTSSDSVFLPNDSGEKKNDSSTSKGVDKYSRFLIHLNNAVEDMSSGVSEEQYVKYLSQLSITNKFKSVPEKMHKRLKEKLKNSLSSEIEEMIKDENLKEKLQQLEKLTDEAMLQEGMVKVWRPNGIVSDHVRSHLMEVKLNHKDHLEKRVREKEQDFECVLSNVVRLRTQVRSLESRLQVLKTQGEDSSVVDRTDKMIADKVENLI